MILENQKKTLELIIKSANERTLKKVVFSKPVDKSIVKAVGSLKNIGGNVVLQVEYFTSDNKAKHENVSIDDEAALGRVLQNFLQINILTTSGDCEYKRSKSGNDVLIGENRLKNCCEKVEIAGNDRKKAYILGGSENFLIELGVSDKNGRPHDKKLPKLRQINRFLEYIRDIDEKIPKNDVLYIADLCCGKSYLSFAVYYYFSAIKNRKVVMYCVDLKPDVIEYCAEVAKRVGFNGMKFTCGDVSAFEPEHTPDMVVSLHACDTATDLVLDKASGWKTKIILSTPCCHHKMNHNLNCPTLSFIAEHSMFRQKFCDAATDALRAKKLESFGYAVEAVELVDPDDTPKNILIRAILSGKPSEKAKEEYLAARRFLYGDKR